MKVNKERKGTKQKSLTKPPKSELQSERGLMQCRSFSTVTDEISHRF